MKRMNFQQKASRGSGMTRIGLSLLLALGFASATSIQENERELASKLDSIESRRGIDFGGTISAVFLHSAFSSPQNIGDYNHMPDVERNEYAQFDLNIAARPWQDTRFNMVLRMGDAMQDYFTAAAKQISVPWMNLEGNVGTNFYYVVGDFRQQYTPLTLYTPGVEIMYEPEIYRRQRYMAQKQVFLEGNQRNLQGLNLQFRHYLDETIGEVRAEGILSRLRRIEVLDQSGATGNLLPNEEIAGASQAGSMDKYLAALNLELLPMKRNVMVGGSYLRVWDDASSLTYEYVLNQTYLKARGLSDDVRYKYRRLPVNPTDSLPQKTNIFSFRAGADGAALLQNENLILDFTAEYALSSDDVYEEWSNYVFKDSITQELTILTDDFGKVYDTLRTYSHSKQTSDGSALLAQLNVGYQQKDVWMARLGVDYIMNDSGWFNNMAQSPSFFARRIMNIDKDGDQSKWGIHSPLYTTFDALYHYAPKFSPASKKLGNDDNALKDDGQTDSYNIAAFSKNSWTTSTLTRKEIALVNRLSDPSIQMSLPNGLATSNRTGVQAKLLGGFGAGNALEAQALFLQMDEMDALDTLGKMSFSEMGVGMKIGLFKLLNMEPPGVEFVEFSGSAKMSSRKLAGAEQTSQFINAGLYARFLKRFGFAMGFQMIDMEVDQELAVVSIPIVKGTQNQWMVGLDYTLAPNAWLSINFGKIHAKNTYQSMTYDYDNDGKVDVDMSNLPTYLSGSVTDAIANGDVTYVDRSLVNEFTQTLIEATIYVDF